MTDYPLEWGWHTSSSSNASEGQPKTTFLGRRSDRDTNLAAWGDLKCQGVCFEGGDRGTTQRTNLTVQESCVGNA